MTQMKIFAKFHLNNFYLLIVPYHAAKFEKILRADPEIQKRLRMNEKMMTLIFFKLYTVYVKK